MLYTFNEKSITIPGGTIMHEGEKPIMKQLAKWACTNGGDIIEFGFGMGISANYIQQHNIKSHTICERNPAVIKRLKKGAQYKPNVIILEGDGVDNVDKMKTYDGIFFDCFMPAKDPKYYNGVYFLNTVLYKLVKENTKFSTGHWGNGQAPHVFTDRNIHTLKVSPPKNDYYNGDYYNIHQITLRDTDDINWQK